jgi:hypothetical protein
LPLERFLRLVEQAHVLDRDHRLVDEGVDQLDLPGLERLYLMTTHCDDTKYRALAKQRRSEHRPVPSMCPHACTFPQGFGLVENIANIDLTAFERGATCRPVRADSFDFASGAPVGMSP